MVSSCSLCFFFFFNDTATTEIYTLTLHDALPISHRPGGGAPDATAAPNHQAAHRAAPRRGRLARVDAVAGDARCARRSEPQARADSLNREAQRLLSRFQTELQSLRDALRQSQVEVSRLKGA